MKVSIDRKALAKVFAAAKPFAPRRSPKPILLNVKLSAGEDGATLSATDLETGVRFELSDFDVLAPGSALLPVDRFAALLKDNKDDTLHIDADEKGVTIRGERVSMTWATDKPADFPATTWEIKPRTGYVVLPAEAMAELIKRTLYACDTESSRYALGGVLFELDGETLIAVATDGRRLVKAETKVTLRNKPTFKLPAPKVKPGAKAAPHQEHVIVPFEALKRIAKALPKSGNVRLGVDKNCAFLQTETITVSARLLEGRFPDWRRCIPLDWHGQNIELETGPLMDALKVVAVACSEESRGVDFDFSNGDSALTLTAKSADNGQAQTRLPIRFDGEPVAITLDPLVCEFLATLGPKEIVTLQLKDHESAAVWRFADYVYVTMPLARDR